MPVSLCVEHYREYHSLRDRAQRQFARDRGLADGWPMA
jgi:hypothetical protein